MLRSRELQHLHRIHSETPGELRKTSGREPTLNPSLLSTGLRLAPHLHPGLLRLGKGRRGRGAGWHPVPAEVDDRSSSWPLSTASRRDWKWRRPVERCRSLECWCIRWAVRFEEVLVNVEAWAW